MRAGLFWVSAALVIRNEEAKSRREALWLATFCALHVP